MSDRIIRAITSDGLVQAAAIDDAKHKIVRWRLLVPALGHVFQFPGWMTLGLAHAGCVAWLLALVFIAWAHAPPSPLRPPYEAACLAIVAGASAPFFTSMG